MPQNEPRLTDAEETLLTRTLERQPHVAVPANFAARVATALPPPSPRKAALPAAWVASAITTLVLTGAMFALAPTARPALNNLAFDLQMLMLAELCGIGWLFSLRRSF